MWVVLFHIRGNLRDEFPAAGRMLSPILDHGDLGVDLFFALSGFLLTLNYIDRTGARINGRATAKFLWNRLARVWPVYFVTLNIAAAWHGWLTLRGGPDPVQPKDFSALSYLRQVTMVVMWNEPDNYRLTWDGPAWSVSAEWLAYLLFPVIALLLYRLASVLRIRHLLACTVLLQSPTVILAVLGQSLYLPYLWVPRLLGSFVAGGLACVVVRRLPRTARNEKWASRLATLLGLSIVAILYLTAATHHPRYYALALFLFVPLLVTLSIARRGLARLLSTRALVLGGHISYSLYLVHMLLIEPIWWAQTVWPGALATNAVGPKVLFLLVPAVALGIAYLMWRFVEEPARHAMSTIAASWAVRSRPEHIRPL